MSCSFETEAGVGASDDDCLACKVGLWVWKAHEELRVQEGGCVAHGAFDPVLTLMLNDWKTSMLSKAKV